MQKGKCVAASDVIDLAQRMSWADALEEYGTLQPLNEILSVGFYDWAFEFRPFTTFPRVGFGLAASSSIQITPMTNAWPPQHPILTFKLKVRHEPSFRQTTATEVCLYANRLWNLPIKTAAFSLSEDDPGSTKGAWSAVIDAATMLIPEASGSA